MSFSATAFVVVVNLFFPFVVFASQIAAHLSANHFQFKSKIPNCYINLLKALNDPS